MALTEVVGIRRQQVEPGYNLFIADAYQLLTFAESNGICEINMSRGGEEQKLNLGANRFNLLNNWILNSSPDAGAELEAIAGKCREDLAVDGSRKPMIGRYRLE